jgi:hypothetical protein
MVMQHTIDYQRLMEYLDKELDSLKEEEKNVTD